MQEQLAKPFKNCRRPDNLWPLSGFPAESHPFPAFAPEQSFLAALRTSKNRVFHNCLPGGHSLVTALWEQDGNLWLSGSTRQFLCVHCFGQQRGPFTVPRLCYFPEANYNCNIYKCKACKNLGSLKIQCLTWIFVHF